MELVLHNSYGQSGSETKTIAIQREQRFYYLTDNLGSVRVTVDQYGDPVGYDDDYPFGKRMPGRSNNTSNPHDAYKFTGKELDKENGIDLEYFGARYYDAEIGRFLSIDPHSSDYPETSPYTYVTNNPIDLIDPNGEKWATSEDLTEANQISQRYTKIQNSLHKQEKTLPDQIDNAIVSGKFGKAIKLLKEKMDLPFREKQLASAMTELKALGTDTKMTFTFNKLPSTASKAELSENQKGTVVINHIGNNIGNLSHELKHAYQVLMGDMISNGGFRWKFVRIRPIDAELEAYQRQYGVSPESMPYSDIGRPTTYNAVTRNYIRGIYYFNQNGVKKHTYAGE